MVTYIPILVAFIAGIVALWQAKLNILTKARLEWIQDVRTILSNYLSEVESINILAKNWQAEKNLNQDKKKQGKETDGVFENQLYDQYLASHSKCNVLNKQLLLCFNHSRIENTAIINQLNILDQNLDEDRVFVSSIILSNSVKELIRLVNAQLFIEWNKAKRFY